MESEKSQTTYTNLFPFEEKGAQLKIYMSGEIKINLSPRIHRSRKF